MNGRIDECLDGMNGYMLKHGVFHHPVSTSLLHQTLVISEARSTAMPSVVFLFDFCPNSFNWRLPPGVLVGMGVSLWMF
jgi:hypothetical protein